MIAIRRILCPIDFSEFGDRAVRHATSVARWYGAEIHALHVAPILPEAWPVPPAVDRATGDLALLADLQRHLDCRLAPARAADVPVETCILNGGAAHEIVDYARRTAADLIVMGTHGRTGFRRLILGSVAATVLRKAPCPVLTVGHADGPAHADGPPFRHVLYAVDLQPDGETIHSLALSLAQEAAANLTLAHVIEPFFEEEIATHTHVSVAHYKQFLQSQLHDRLTQLIPAEVHTWCQSQVVVRIGTPWVELVRAANDCGAEIIVMGVRQGRGALDRLVFGSTAQRVLQHARCPVLTVATRPASALRVADAVADNAVRQT
jgi:nucleotide-binding universal stress UspA family protein